LSSLRETLKLAGGGLIETSREEAQKRGLVTPLGTKTATAGATPDMAKMSGTPAQKQSSIRSALMGSPQESQDLATTLRRQQTNKTARAGDAQAARNMAEEIGGLSGLGERVGALVKDKIADAYKADPQSVDLTAAMAIDPITGEALSQEQIAQLERILNPNPGFPEDQAQALKEFNEGLGVAPDQQYTIDQVLENFGPQAEQIAAQNSAQAQFDTVKDAINAGALDFQKMGFSGIEELEGLLGEPLADKSIPELINTIDLKIEEEYSQVEQLQGILNDPYSNPNDRANARAQLKEMGVAGVRAAENDLEEIAGDIAEATTIEIAGKDTDIEALLSSDYISGVANLYFNGTEEEKQAIKDDKNLEGLVKYLEAHPGVFEAAVKSVGDDISQFSKVQTSNNALAKPQDGIELDDEWMEAFYPGKWKSGTFKDLSKEPVPAVLSLLQTNPNAQSIKSNLDILISQYGYSPQDLVNLGTTQIQQLGLDNPNSPKWQASMAKFAKKQELDALSTDNPDEQGIARALGLTDSQALHDIINEGRINKNSGWFANSQAFDKFMEMLPNDQPDTWGANEWAALAGNLKASYGDGKLGFHELDGLPNLEQIAQDAMAYGSQERDIILDTVKEELDETGQIAEENVAHTIGQYYDDINTLEKFYQDDALQSKANFDIKTKIFNDTYGSYITSKGDDALKAAGGEDTFTAIVRYDTPATTRAGINNGTAKGRDHLARVEQIGLNFPEGSLQRKMWDQYYTEYEEVLNKWREDSIAIKKYGTSDLR